MRKFNVANDFGTPVALSTTYKTAIALLAATASLRRGKITEITVGPISNPVIQDCNIIYAVFGIAISGAGTPGTSGATPVWIGAQEGGTNPSSGAVINLNYSAEPTTVAGRFWTKALNQHSGFIWYSPDEMGLPWAATNNVGLVCQSKGATSDYNGTVLWEVKYEE